MNDKTPMQDERSTSGQSRSTGGLGLYRAIWFSSVDWAWNSANIIAESTEQAESFIDGKCQREYRSKPYQKDSVDSLQLEFVESREIPFET